MVIDKARKFILLMLLLLASIGTLCADVQPKEPLVTKYPLTWQSDRPVEMKFYIDGAASFYQRLNMIARAHHTIEVEYFIYNFDRVGRIFTQALVNSANRGVKVRILVDRSLPIFDFDKYYAQAVKAHGIEVRYYNGALDQHRNHRKLLVVDDQEAMTGGRNIGEEYYNLSPRYNLVDRDVWVVGEVAKVMRESFDTFWNSKYAKTPKKPKKPNESFYTNGDEYTNCDHSGFDSNCMQYYQALKEWEKKKQFARESMFSNEEDQQLEDEISWIGQQQAEDSASFLCPTLSFISDAPGSKSKARVLRGHLFNLIKGAKSSVLIDSPYFVPPPKLEDLITETIERGVGVRLLTNSSYSTDAIYVSAYTTFNFDRWAKMGIKTYLYGGENSRLKEEQRLFKVKEGKRETRWGLHGKSMVVDNLISVVGTMNADARSLNINAEMSLICHDGEEIAKELTSQIENLIIDSEELNEKGKTLSGKSLFTKLPFWKRVSIFLLTVPSHLFYMLL
jgi:cardiolipin synthase C